MSKSGKRLSLLSLILMLLAVLMSACSTTTTTASCAFVVGNGRSGNDSKLHRIIYPGQSINIDADDEVTAFVPCNSRNYIINNGSVRNANGDIVGDRGTLIVAATSSGVPITLAVTALWTLNQSEAAMRKFYDVCHKYQCWSPKDQTGTTNFATAGWNGMLAENFGPALEASAKTAAFKVDDSIWKTQNPDMYKTLSDNMSAVFADKIRANLGYSEDLFCGSGNSNWADPAKPGQGTFNCSPVRIVVNNVERGQVQTEGSSEETNRQRLRNAEAVYGPNAGFWLGLQDTIDKCKAANASCAINIGGISGSPAIVMPANPVATPVPTGTLQR